MLQSKASMTVAISPCYIAAVDDSIRNAKLIAPVKFFKLSILLQDNSFLEF